MRLKGWLESSSRNCSFENPFIFPKQVNHLDKSPNNKAVIVWLNCSWLNKKVVFLDSVNLHGMVQKGSKSFEISSGNKVLVTGRTKFDTRVTSDEKTTKFNPTEDSVHLTEENVYGEFEHRGHKYGGKYRSIKSVTIDQGGKFCNNILHRNSSMNSNKHNPNSANSAKWTTSALTSAIQERIAHPVRPLRTRLTAEIWHFSSIRGQC